MRGEDSVIPESILNEVEAFPFLPVLTVKDNIDSFLSPSGGGGGERVSSGPIKILSTCSKQSSRRHRQNKPPRLFNGYNIEGSKSPIAP